MSTQRSADTPVRSKEKGLSSPLKSGLENPPSDIAGDQDSSPPHIQNGIHSFPDDWEKVDLASLFEIKHGYAFDGKFFKPDGNFVLMTPGHFYEKGGFKDQGAKTKYYTGTIPNEYLLAKNDLVVAMTEQKAGLLGSTAFVPDSEKYLHKLRLGLCFHSLIPSVQILTTSRD